MSSEQRELVVIMIGGDIYAKLLDIARKRYADKGLSGNDMIAMALSDFIEKHEEKKQEKSAKRVATMR